MIFIIVFAFNSNRKTKVNNKRKKRSGRLLFFVNEKPNLTIKSIGYNDNSTEIFVY